MLIPTASYAISLDDDEEDAEDVSSYLNKAKQSAKNENFSTAKSFLKKAKAFALLGSKVKETERYIESKEKVRDERLEKERLAKLEKERQEKEEEERLARLERESQQAQTYNSDGFRGIRKDDCYAIEQNAPREVCLKGTGGDACYFIDNSSLRNVCLNGAKSDACYGLNSNAQRKICVNGVGTDACFYINDYNTQKSCTAFSGSTTFWLILSSYGYTTW